MCVGPRLEFVVGYRPAYRSVACGAELRVPCRDHARGAVGETHADALPRAPLRLMYLSRSATWMRIVLEGADHANPPSRQLSMVRSLTFAYLAASLLVNHGLGI